VRVELTDYGRLIDALAGVNDQHDTIRRSRIPRR
jgi:hypothetical protein